jgi:hypothetical protein
MRAFRAFCFAVSAATLGTFCAQVCAQAGDVPPAGGAPAQARVVLIQPEGEPPRPGLEPALRIQLRGTAEVIAVPQAFPSDVPARLSAASALAEEHDADWVLWTDPPQTTVPRSEHAVLYLVGRQNGRALIEVVSVPGGEGPEVDRSLALKVHELIDVREGAVYALGNAEVPEPEAQQRRVQLWLEAGAQAGIEGDGGAAFDVLIAIGPSLTTPALLLALPIELAIGLPRRFERDGDEVSWTELGATLWLKLGARLGPAVLGGALGAKLAFTDVEGTTQTGRQGTATELLPSAVASIDGELPLSSSLGARLALGTELRWKRQHFLIEGEDVGNTGRVVPFARLSLVWHAF